MAAADKRDVVERIIYNILEGTQTIAEAKQDAERDMETKIDLGRGDLVYIRSRVADYVAKNEQWMDDAGTLQTTDIGRMLLALLL